MTHQSTMTLHEGDNRETLRRLIDEGVRVHSVVTDPPYGLVSIKKRFGGKKAKPAGYGSDGAFQRAGAGFMGQCYHPETEILTRRGWVRVGEVQEGECVATLDPETELLEWQPVANTHGFDFDGYLKSIQHRSGAQVVTPNHKVLASTTRNGKLRLVEAQHLSRTLHLSAQAKPVSGIKDLPVTIHTERDFGTKGERRLESRSFEPDAFCFFLGLFLGDGYVCNRSNDHPANDYFGFAVSKPRKVSAIRDTLGSLGIRFTETKGAGAKVQFYCYDFALLEYLRPLGKAHEKFIPEDIFYLDASHLEHLYKGLIETDGTRQGKNQEVYFTASRHLADDFQRLCLLVGRSASIQITPARETEILGNFCTRRESFTCCVLQPGKRLYGENGTCRNGDIVKDFAYQGKVHCLTVERHHTLYTRFDGKPVWSGNSWDGNGIERDPEFWRLVWEILLPGGYCLAFSGARTGHWQAVAMEQAGFDMHPMTGWVFGSGFPKAHDAAKAIDKALGEKGETVPSGAPQKRLIPGATQHATGDWEKSDDRTYQPGEYVPATDEAAEWEGWKYGAAAMKPALEPIYVGQKPIEAKTGARNLLEYGVGALNIDGCRVEAEKARPLVVSDRRSGNNTYGDGLQGSKSVTGGTDLGRHPANLCHDGSDDVRDLFPGGSDTSAARFFNAFPLEPEALYYHAKASAKDRITQCNICGEHGVGGKPDCACTDDSDKRSLRGHPTVKPIGLMRHLVRLVTPPGGSVLDPFAGTGTTGQAAREEGFDCILMEAETAYCSDIRARLNLPSAKTSKTDQIAAETVASRVPVSDPAIAALLGDPAPVSATDPMLELVG